MQQPDSVEAEEPSSSSPELLAKAMELLANVEIIDIRPVTIQANISDGVIPGKRVSSVEVDVGAYFAAEEGLYGNRFDYEFKLKGDPDQAPMGQVHFSLVLDYSVREGFTPDQEAADYVARTTGFFAAYPYARELFQSLGGRLQFDPMILGLIKRGSLQPGSVSLAPHG
jgi:hypothetical protein